MKIQDMAQLNLNLTDQFVKDREKYMKKKGIQSKSEAVRTAVHEAVTCGRVVTIEVVRKIAPIDVVEKRGKKW